MDRFSAHMDRSWDLISRGETVSALVAARQALGLNEESPEVHNLIGYIYALDGSFDEALESYHKAIDLDEWYLDPILNAADLLVHPDADPKEAIRLCRRAADMELTPEEYAEVILVEVDAFLNIGNVEKARQRLEELVNIECLPAICQVVAGRALFDLGELESARALVEGAIEVDPSISDAWYCKGLIEKENGQRVAAVRAFLETRKRDLLLPALPWSMSEDKLRGLVLEAIEKLEPEYRKMLAETVILMDKYPTDEQICMEMDPRQVFLIEGVKPHSGVFDKLFIFSLNVERVISPLADTIDEIKRFIEHELGINVVEKEIDSIIRHK